MTHPMLERLVAMAASEQQAIADVSRAVRHLEETQAAKAQLQCLPADLVRAAINARSRALTGMSRP
jgi:hypothetical protein